MIKSVLTSFIQKYNLGESAESVIIKSENDEIFTQFITDDKNVFGQVKSVVSLPDGDYPIFNTSQLQRLLSVLGEDISVKVIVPGKNIELSDGSTKVTVVLADPNNIPKSGGLKKVPPFEVEFPVDGKMVNTFVKGCGALPDVESVTILASDNDVKLVLGYQENVNTNRITIVPESVSSTKAFEPMSFSSKYIREIFVNNKDISSGTIKVSSAGLMHISYSNANHTTNYYIVKLDRKD